MRIQIDLDPTMNRRPTKEQVLLVGGLGLFLLWWAAKASERLAGGTATVRPRLQRRFRP